MIKNSTAETSPRFIYRIKRGIKDPLNRCGVDTPDILDLMEISTNRHKSVDVIQHVLLPNTGL